MAFGDSNDIKINVTVDTESAVKSAQEIQEAFKGLEKSIGGDFKSMAQVAKNFSAIKIAEIKKAAKEQVADTQKAAREEVANIKEASNQKIAEIRKGVDATKEAEKTKRAEIKAGNMLDIQAARDAAKAVRDAEVSRRQEIALSFKKETQLRGENLQLEKQANAIKKIEAKSAANIAELGVKNEAKQAKSASLERIAGLRAVSAIVTSSTAKDVKIFSEGESTKRTEIKRTIEEIRLEAAKVRQETAKIQLAGAGKAGGMDGLIPKLPSLAASIYIAKEAAAAISALAGSVAQLSAQGARLEGFSTAFDTLQRSVGRVPTESIETLRKATQGLISDTEIYQRANQALLLNVPTSLFEESAEAAVKLGRAMGIDAANALESLSIGLGRQSRLYLDNLGIVVSAEEAYQNFAAANGKVASNLTESEKRLAFFQLTSKKLKDALAALPPVQETVGTQFTKLSASVENLSAKFTAGFNGAQPLAQSYGDLKVEVDKLQGAFERLGNVYANLISFIISNPLSSAIVKGTVGLIDEASKNLAQKFGSGLEDRISRARDLVRQLENELKTEQGRSNASRGYLDTLVGTTPEAVQKKLDAARLALDALNKEVEESGNKPPVKIRVDTTEIANFAENTAQTLSALNENIGESLNTIKIPGLDQGQANAALEQVKQLGAEIERGKVKAEDAEAAISKVYKTLAEQAKAVNIGAIDKSIESLDPKSKDYQAQLAQLKAAREAYQNTLAAEPKQIERINALIQKGIQLGKESIKKTKDGATATVASLKQQDRAWTTFLKKLNRELTTGLDPDIQADLADIFRTTTVGSQALIDKLKALGVEVEKRKGDLDALAKEAGEFNDVALAGGKILATGEESKQFSEDIQKANQQLKDIQSNSFNLRDAIFGKETDANGKKLGGGFFGFDLDLENLDIQGEAELAQTLQGTLSTAFNMAIDGISREDAPELGRVVGTAVGAAIGAYLGDPATGAQVGGFLGEIVGRALESFGKDKPGTRARKDIDEYFAEAFDGERLGVVIEGEIFKATQRRKKERFGAIAGAVGTAVFGTFSGAVLGAVGLAVDDGVNTVGEQLKQKIPPTFVTLGDLVFDGFTKFAGDVRFGIEEAGKGFNAFSSYFNTLPQTVQSAFTGVGLAYGELLGVSEEQGKLIGTALANNIGGSLQNLQVLVQATGESLEDLSDKVLKAFLDSKLSIDDAYNSLKQLQNIFEKGIPGAVGAYEEAISNVSASLEAKNPGRFVVDSLRDVATEGIEAGKSFDFVVQKLGESLGLGAEQVQLLFFALRNAGINSLQDLENASDETLLSILQRLNKIKEGVATTTEDVANIAIIPDIKKPTTSSTPRGGGGKSPQEIAKENAQKLKDEVYKLVTASKEYEKILARLNRGELDSIAAGKAIIELRKEVTRLLKRETDLEKDLRAEQEKGRKANKARLAELAKELQKVQESLKKIQDGANKADAAFDFKKVIPFIKDVNNLGVVARSTGVSLESATSILTRGFLQGRLSLAEFNKELKATKDTLGPGIPKAVGAVSQAFKNLVDAGTQGGKFSVDAFNDIFVEFREKFNAESSELRKTQEKQLRKSVDDANAALQAAVGPDSIAAARETLDVAEKALKDFYDAPRVPNLADLRSELERVFPKEQVDIFFRALDESSINSFDGFETAGEDAVVTVLARLNELGFKFGETSEDIKKVNQNLNEQATAANGGIDAMKGALDLIKAFNEGASLLPPAFNDTGVAIAALSGPLTSISSEFSVILDKLAQLGDQKYENTVIFNVKTQGDQVSMNIADILFGETSETTITTGSGSQSNPPAPQVSRKDLSEEAKREIRALEAVVRALRKDKKKRTQYLDARDRLRALKRSYGLEV